MTTADINKSIRQNPMYPFLMLLVLSAIIGFQGWRILLNNFAVDVVGVDGFQMGVIQSFREVPGFLVFLVLFVLLIMKEHRLASVSVIVLGVGISLTGFFPSFLGLILTTIVMSLGFHYFETMNKTLTLQHFSKRESPIVLARFKSYGALGNIAIGALVWWVSSPLPYWVNYLIIGLLVLFAGVATLFFKPVKKESVKQNKGIVLRKKYWLFYVLNFLSGARRQIFVVFAVFLLVEKYDFSIKEIAILFVINNIISYFVTPYIGKAINRFGERIVLSFEYGGLILVFLGYAVLDERMLIAALYVVNHIFYGFSIGIDTYLQKIADPKDITPSASVGYAINHITAVFIPVLGGMLWIYDFRIPFEVGIVLSVISLVFVQMIRVKKEASLNEVSGISK